MQSALRVAAASSRIIQLRQRSGRDNLTGAPRIQHAAAGLPVQLISLGRFSVLRHRGLSSNDDGAAGVRPFKLIIYSKPDCSLCDGLKDKVEALLDRAQYSPSFLSDVSLEVRDITTDPAWESEYAMVIPVLTSADADGANEKKIRRPSPRISADRLQIHIQKALEAGPEAGAQQA